MSIKRLEIVMAAVVTIAVAEGSRLVRGQTPEGPGVLAGSWQPLTNQPSFNAEVCLLLTDGTVMCHEVNSPRWWRLSPDAFGNYVKGSWTQLQPMAANYAPFEYASAVLADGRVAIVGGEINNGVAMWTNQGAIYDPRLNSWTPTTAPISIGNSPSVLLANGRLLVGEYNTKTLAFLDPVTLGWTTATPNKNDVNSEEGWTLLPQGTVLTVNVVSSGTAEKYAPSMNQWLSASTTGVGLTATCGGTSFEVGPALLRPNGTVFAAGATGHTSIYTPGAGMADTGSWTPGPDFPAVLGIGQFGVNDGPAALLPNGNVLVMASPTDCSPGARFFEFDGSTLTQVPSTPKAATDSSDLGIMLVLPTGQVLLTDLSNDIQVYTPGGAVNPAWAPTITAAPAEVRPGGSYVIVGTQFNGLSQGAVYGAERQTSSNYPLVRITNRASGHVSYMRTHDHSTMAVATQGEIVATYFDVPASAELGLSDIEVVANGIASLSLPVGVGYAEFVDDPVIAGTTPTRASLIAELRSRIDAIRVSKGLGGFPWTEPGPVANSTLIHAQHVLELRGALQAAYSVASLPAPSYTDPGLTVGTPLRANHVAELRRAIVNIEMRP